jgi:hypothetical protein
VLLGKIRLDEKFNDIGNRNRDLPVCSIMPQLSTLPRATGKVGRKVKEYVYMAVAMLSEIEYVITEFWASSVLETRLCFYISYSLASHNGNLAKYFPREIFF